MATGVAAIMLTCALASAFLPVGDVLYRENGVLEQLSLGFWILSCLLAFAGAIRSRCSLGRVLALWWGWMAGLAALRELDAHVWLNPRYLGEWGVRFRVDWWMDATGSVWLKCGWAVLLLTVGFLVIYHPIKLRGILWRLVREGDPVAWLLVLAAGFLAFGYVIDDILRPVQSVSLGTKQLIEEASETIGAGLYCAGMVFQLRMPVRVPLGRTVQELTKVSPH